MAVTTQERKVSHGLKILEAASGELAHGLDGAAEVEAVIVATTSHRWSGCRAGGGRIAEVEETPGGARVCRNACRWFCSERTGRRGEREGLERHG
ncbi:hypothetical protein FH972_023720 [Carpinus fangiana]|uniref:Uncharacterized protein n=1 Tax=Carpinus fangiana TaxID=176857 RepID=A0A5N6KW04_9ROSI|nr:hypothetical protein FH972_023720 [Carpinus fangiana]